MGKARHLSLNVRNLKTYLKVRELYLIGERSYVSLAKQLKITKGKAEQYIRLVRETLVEEGTNQDLDVLRAEVDAQYMNELQRIDKEIRKLWNTYKYVIVDGRSFKHKSPSTFAITRMYSLRSSILTKRAHLWGLVKTNIRIKGGDTVLGDKITTPGGKRVIEWQEVKIEQKEKNEHGDNGSGNGKSRGNGSRTLRLPRKTQALAE
jgi:hypothetical protein